MTLITYPTRVHFADGVLEEALHSELDRVSSSKVMLVCDDSMGDGELSERVMGGLPTRIKTERVTIPDGTKLRDFSQDVARTSFGPDVIIAFGSSQAIDFSRKTRYFLDQNTGKRPSLFALPAIDGMPDPCARNLESKQAGLPAVVICDPTVIMNSDKRECRRAVVMSLTRCIEAYLSAGYNPPADGMALDGLSRCRTSLERIENSVGLDLQREVMASSLNAFLSQEKGVGPAQTMTSSLMKDTPKANRAAIARLVLPGTMRARDIDSRKAGVLRKVLADTDIPLADATEHALADMQMPHTLADIGVPHTALDAAAKSVEGNVGLTFQNARQVLEQVYESA